MNVIDASFVTLFHLLTKFPVDSGIYYAYYDDDNVMWLCPYHPYPSVGAQPYDFTLRSNNNKKKKKKR